MLSSYKTGHNVRNGCFCSYGKSRDKNGISGIPCRKIKEHALGLANISWLILFLDSFSFLRKPYKAILVFSLLHQNGFWFFSCHFPPVYPSFTVMDSKYWQLGFLPNVKVKWVKVKGENKVPEKGRWAHKTPNCSIIIPKQVWTDSWKIRIPFV